MLVTVCYIYEATATSLTQHKDWKREETVGLALSKGTQSTYQHVLSSLIIDKLHLICLFHLVLRVGGYCFIYMIPAEWKEQENPLLLRLWGGHAIFQLFHHSWQAAYVLHYFMAGVSN